MSGKDLGGAIPDRFDHPATCTVEGCDRPYRCKGVCSKHDQTPARAQAHRDESNNRRYLNYGTTSEKYQAMLAGQGGVCAICGEPPKTKRLAVDHDHECCPPIKDGCCGKCIRGLLCLQCNTKLGWLERYGDSVNDYLNAWSRGKKLLDSVDLRGTS